LGEPARERICERRAVRRLDREQARDALRSARARHDLEAACGAKKEAPRPDGNDDGIRSSSEYLINLVGPEQAAQLEERVVRVAAVERLLASLERRSGGSEAFRSLKEPVGLTKSSFARKVVPSVCSSTIGEIGSPRLIGRSPGRSGRSSR